jgi:hypothetical protein
MSWGRAVVRGGGGENGKSEGEEGVGERRVNVLATGSVDQSVKVRLFPSFLHRLRRKERCSSVVLGSFTFLSGLDAIVQPVASRPISSRSLPTPLSYGR